MSIPQVSIPAKLKSVPKYVITFIVALLLLSAIGTYMILNPSVPSTSMPTTKVGWGTIYPYVSLTGQIGNHQTVDISSSSGGQIVRWLVHEGSTIKANAPLAYFSDYQLNKQIYDNLEAGLEDLIAIENGQIQLGNLNRISAAPLSTVIQDKAAVNQARIQYISAKRMTKDAFRQYNLSKVVSPNQKQSLHQNVDQASNTVAIDESLLNQATTKLQTDQQVINDAATIKADQQAVTVAQQQVIAAQSITSATQNQLTAVTQQTIQNAKSALDQAESQVTIDQSLLNQAQTKLTSDEQSQATTSVTQQDQANINLLQTQLNGADAQLATDQAAKASPSVLQADQNAISDLQQQITAAKNQLSTDQSQPAPQYVIQEDNAAIQVAQQQVDAAQTVETDDQTMYNQAQSSTNQASVASIQTALAQANGNVQVDQALINQAQAKLNSDESSSQPAAQIQQDQAAIQVAQQQLNAAQVLFQDAQSAKKINDSPAQSQVLSAKINYDQAMGTENVDHAAMNMATAKWHVDVSPLDQRGIVSQTQNELQAKEAVDQATMNVLNAKENLIQSELLAPVAGIVVSINVSAGTRIYSAQTAATLYPTHGIQQIIALTDASQVDQMKVQDRVTFNSPDFNGSGKGIVAFISPVPLNQSQGNTYQYPINIHVTKVPRGTASGMLVNMKVFTSPIAHVVVVSSHAIFTQNGNMGVYVKTAPNQFTFHTVQISSSDSKNVQISGIKLGTVVSLKQP